MGFLLQKIVKTLGEEVKEVHKYTPEYAIKAQQAAQKNLMRFTEEETN